jgi:hypothetical protein
LVFVGLGVVGGRSTHTAVAGAAQAARHTGHQAMLLQPGNKSYLQSQHMPGSVLLVSEKALHADWVRAMYTCSRGICRVHGAQHTIMVAPAALTWHCRACACHCAVGSVAQACGCNHTKGTADSPALGAGRCVAAGFRPGGSRAQAVGWWEAGADCSTDAQQAAAAAGQHGGEALPSRLRIGQHSGLTEKGSPD